MRFSSKKAAIRKATLATFFLLIMLFGLWSMTTFSILDVTGGAFHFYSDTTQIQPGETVKFYVEPQDASSSITIMYPDGTIDLLDSLSVKLTQIGIHTASALVYDDMDQERFFLDIAVGNLSEPEPVDGVQQAPKKR